MTVQYRHIVYCRGLSEEVGGRGTITIYPDVCAFGGWAFETQGSGFADHRCRRCRLVLSCRWLQLMLYISSSYCVVLFVKYCHTMHCAHDQELYTLDDYRKHWSKLPMYWLRPLASPTMLLASLSAMIWLLLNTRLYKKRVLLHTDTSFAPICL